MKENDSDYCSSVVVVVDDFFFSFVSANGSEAMFLLHFIKSYSESSIFAFRSASLHSVCMALFFNGTQHCFNTCSALSFRLTESHSGHIMLHVRFVEEIYDCSTEENKKNENTEEEPHSAANLCQNKF